MAQLKEVYATSKAVFTTHSRAIFSDNLPHEIIILDEGILEELISVQSINLSDLQKLSISSGKKLFKHSKDDVWDLMKFLVNDVEEGAITELPSQFTINMDKEVHRFATTDGITSNLKNFLESDYIYKEEGNEEK